MVDEALSKGAKLVSGGSKHHIGDLQYKPTILTEVTTDMSLVAEEVFGPVISIKKFETEEVRTASSIRCFSQYRLKQNVTPREKA